MAEYIEHEALIAQYDKEHVGAPGRARQLMVEAPAVDVVEVVRCKDCKHYHNTQCFHPSYGDDCAINTERAENDFCSYGIRKEADDDQQKT